MDPSSEQLEPGYLPPELTYTPVPLVGFFGLNPAQDETHSLIWSGFATNRTTDRVPMYFKLVPDNLILPRVKPKKTTYEWYVPKGILKTRWISKHLFDIPSLAVVFFDLDWNDIHWDSKSRLCVERIRHVKNQLADRNIRIVLLLVQKSICVAGDDSMASEKLTHLCNAADIPTNLLMVLHVDPDSNKLMDNFRRLEATFADGARTYYQNSAKVIRGNRDTLNKTTHSLLFVRHHFKLGFYSELKNDPGTALKHYKQAYSNLLEIRMSKSNLFEVKTIAAFINYKICKISFVANFPLDSISQFRKHLEQFKNCPDCPELMFEHKAWLASQFSTFGTLFEAAVVAGLVPSQTQHPGYYFYEAGNEAIKRRRIAITSSAIDFFDHEIPMYQEMLTKSLQVEFWGQRPWRGAPTDPIDPQKELVGLRTLKWREMSVNHMSPIIGLLSQAAGHFKRNKGHRMMRFQMVLMAQEYFETNDFVNCFASVSQVLPFYISQNEIWPELGSHLLRLAIKSSYLSKNVPDMSKLMKQFLIFDIGTQEEKEIMTNNIKGFQYNVQPTFPDSWKVPSVQLEIPALEIDSVVPSEISSDQNVDMDMSGLSFFFDSSALKCKTASGVELPAPAPATTPGSAQTEQEPKVTSTEKEQVAVPQSESLIAQSALLYIELECPKSGTCRKPLLLKYSLWNRTNAIVSLEVSMGNSDNFMFSGNKQVRVDIEQESSVVQNYILYPIVCGFVTLPKLRLVAYPDTANAQPLDELVESCIISELQIMPKGA